MKTTLEHVQEILWRSTSPALPFPKVIAALERETVTGDPATVLRELRRRPDLFRVLDPRMGPWRTRRTTTSAGWTPDPWVLGLRPHGRPTSPVRARLAESLRSLGRRMDQGSATAAARWLFLMEAESTAFSEREI